MCTSTHSHMHIQHTHTCTHRESFPSFSHWQVCYGEEGKDCSNRGTSQNTVTTQTEDMSSSSLRKQCRHCWHMAQSDSPGSSCHSLMVTAASHPIGLGLRKGPTPPPIIHSGICPYYFIYIPSTRTNLITTSRKALSKEAGKYL